MPALIVHGHFYQPPRENPWTGLIEAQPSASPFHDWNERIYSECYGPNAVASIFDQGTGGSRVINNYINLSFNFGPTLLSWLEQHHPETYEQIIAADEASCLTRRGHGNAIAQAYGHAILPLCNERDLRTQIKWGMADFRYRFKREPEALWLPETACNDRVLDALIDEGLRFVILAPNQAGRIRPTSEQVTDEWRSVNEGDIDTSVPYRCLHGDGSGKSIAAFFYDGPTSRAIAFESLLRSSRALVDRFVLTRRNAGDLVSFATDGETYGHHFKFGDICLAHALEVEAPARGFQITNYGEYLEEHAPEFDVQINNGRDGEGTSWSCAHGVGRWIRDCGCQTGGEAGWNQRWRTPLRQALDLLRDENAVYFQDTKGHLFLDPWQARDDSVVLVLDEYRSREQFLYEQAGAWLSESEQQVALAYLELQRMLLLMYTSCGWFFSDLAGIETVQILSYAARAIDLMAELGLPSLRERFLEILSEARSNRPEIGNGADLFRTAVEPLKLGRVDEQALVAE